MDDEMQCIAEAITRLIECLAGWAKALEELGRAAEKTSASLLNLGEEIERYGLAKL